MDNLPEMISKYGFPIIAAGGMGYLIHYVWNWVTKETKPVLGEANTVLIALIDRIRMLDNDLIRLNQKLNTVLHLRGMLKDIEIQAKINAENVAMQASAATKKKTRKSKKKTSEPVYVQDRSNTTPENTLPSDLKS